MRSTPVSWRKWALYGGIIATAYTALTTIADLSSESLSLYAAKLISSTVSGAILGFVAAKIRNRATRRDVVEAGTEEPS